MSEKRFMVFPHNIVWDNQLEEVVCRCILEGIGDAENVCQRLNEQQVTIKQLRQSQDVKEFSALFNQSIALKREIKDLKEENGKLRQMIKENVFQRYREGSLADLEFKAIAYDDIVRVEMSYGSEPKVIVSCRQGKKENVMSFCQMFIPFGVYYEIKELEDEWNI